MSLKKIKDIVAKELAAHELHEPLEVLGWDIVEGDDEGEEHLQVDYLLPDCDSEANVVSITLITEVLQEHGLDLSSLSPRCFKREDRDKLVAVMYQALEEKP